MLDKLLKNGYIKKLPPDPRQVENSLFLARRDVDTATEMLKLDNFDWAFNIAYNSMLQSVRSLMFHMGYRPSSQKSHLAVVRFTETVLGEDYSICLDRMRRKRHRAVYDMVGSISKGEAHNIVILAKKLLQKVEKELKES